MLYIIIWHDWRFRTLWRIGTKTAVWLYPSCKRKRVALPLILETVLAQQSYTVLPTSLLISIVFYIPIATTATITTVVYNTHVSRVFPLAHHVTSTLYLIVLPRNVHVFTRCFTLKTFGPSREATSAASKVIA